MWKVTEKRVNLFFHSMGGCWMMMPLDLCFGEKTYLPGLE